MKKAHNIVLLSLGDEVFGEVSGEKIVDMLWTKLESWYMSKSLHNRLSEEIVICHANALT